MITEKQEIVLVIIIFIGLVSAGTFIIWWIGPDDVYGQEQDYGLTRDYLYMLNNGTSFTCKETLAGEFIGCFKNSLMPMWLSFDIIKEPPIVNCKELFKEDQLCELKPENETQSNATGGVY